MKYKIGDKVRVTCNDNGSDDYVGEIHEIVGFAGSDYSNPGKYPYRLDRVSASFGEHEITLIKTSMITKISSAMKKFLDTNVQAQVKAGYRDSSTLELTEAGKTALLELYAAGVVTEFTAAATTKIADEKAEKDEE